MLEKTVRIVHSIESNSRYSNKKISYCVRNVTNFIRNFF